jgi:hypothetical protein
VTGEATATVLRMLDERRTTSPGYAPRTVNQLHALMPELPPLLEPTLAGISDMIGPLPDRRGMHLDRGYDSTKTRNLLQILSYEGHIAVKGVPAPIQAGRR